MYIYIYVLYIIYAMNGQETYIPIYIYIYIYIYGYTI